MPRHNFADCELAWTSFDKPAQVFNSRWGGYVRDSGETKVLHPTQKALEVMKWCIREFSEPGHTIFDPYMGSGTVAVASILLNRHFIGIEKNFEYFAQSETRVKAAYAHQALGTKL